jgi:hypothetical protein
MPKQLQLFPMPSPSSREIRELVQDRLYGFQYRQQARNQKRELVKKQQLARKKERSACA